MQFGASRASVDFHAGAIEVPDSRSIAIQPPAPAMERGFERTNVETLDQCGGRPLPAKPAADLVQQFKRGFGIAAIEVSLV